MLSLIYISYQYRKIGGVLGLFFSIFVLMQKQIASYLFINKTCPLPGFGTLSIIHLDAEADFTNKLITAPKPFIHFVNSETDLSGLLNYLTTTIGKSIYEVTAALDSFCCNLKKELVGHSSVKFYSVGTFYVDSTGNISFKEEEISAVFSQSVFAPHVIHPDIEHRILVGDKEMTNTIMTELLIPRSKKTDFWWIWAIILGIITLLALVFYFTQINWTPSFGNTIKI